jgi:hypothetical protein
MSISQQKLFNYEIAIITINTDKSMYSQNCIKRSPFGQRKGGLLRQVAS